MKIKELLYQTPEMTEEKLLEIMSKNIGLVPRQLCKRVQSLHKLDTINESFLKEYDLIQDRKSYLTKSQRDQVIGFVGTCMIF